ncbi:MAG: prepilin-type N-terminal cleavage/methylation domain-containing protein [Ghiorsea sp.]
MKIESNQKGFTLIELMIVVAIIGILASIAIPQFSSFRAKAFNSSAIADLHSLSLAQEGVYTDYQFYGSTQLVATAAGAAAGIAASVGAPSQILMVTATAVGQSMPITMSKNVTAVSNALAAGTAATTVAKHLSGDKAYGAETDQASIFFQPNFVANSVVAGTAVANAAAGTNVTGAPATLGLDLAVANAWGAL